ncbi:hypothetical protein BDL97_16G034000 [Sphagnum fallax]|nr:hypothetical protein BDL97_16G034000 [Sphagnum fallax]
MELLHRHLVNTSNTRCQCNNSMHNLIMYLMHRGILFLWLWILSITIVQEDCHFYFSVSCGQAAAGLCFYQLVLDVGVVAVKLVLDEGFFDATCPNIWEEEEACLSCQDVVLNLLSFPQVGNGAIVLGFVRSPWTFAT